MEIASFKPLKPELRLEKSPRTRFLSEGSVELAELPEFCREDSPEACFRAERWAE
jgi:hypothetical protein